MSGKREAPGGAAASGGSPKGRAAHQRAVWLDLGCGPAKTPAFIGLDRFALPGVDIVCDLDVGIPFADDSVDYVIASHSLEHITNLPATIQEINRVCRDRAIVTIISPYHSTGLNRANPYHKQVFNEHTARFFTASRQAPLVPTGDFDFPHAQVWGLGDSDHSEWSVDMRPLKVEYFYFAPYRGLDESAKRVLRSHLSDVCDQMLVHLVVAKTPLGEDEMRTLAATSLFQETSALRHRRRLETEIGTPDLFATLPGLGERVFFLENQAAPSLAARLSVLEAQIAKGESLQDKIDVALGATSASVAALSQSLVTVLGSQNIMKGESLREYNAAVAALADRLAEHEAQTLQAMNAYQTEIALARAPQAKAVAELQQSNGISERFSELQHRFDALESDHTTFVASMRDRIRSLDVVNAKLPAINQRLSQIVQSGTANERRLDEHDIRLLKVDKLEIASQRLMTEFITRRKRGDRALRFIRQVVAPPIDLSKHISPLFKPLLEASFLSNGVGSKYRLTLTPYISEDDIFAYPVSVRDLRIESVHLAISALSPPDERTHLLNLDIYDADANKIRRAAPIIAGKDDLIRPVHVRLDPLVVKGHQTIYIRVAAANAASSAGVRMFEWRRPRLIPLPGKRGPRLFGLVAGTRLQPLN